MSAVRVRHRLPAFAAYALRLGMPAEAHSAKGCLAHLPRRSSTSEGGSCAATKADCHLAGFPHMDTPQGHEENADQTPYWNGPGGQRWADRQAARGILPKPDAAP